MTKRARRQTAKLQAKQMLAGRFGKVLGAIILSALIISVIGNIDTMESSVTSLVNTTVYDGVNEASGGALDTITDTMALVAVEMYKEGNEEQFDQVFGAIGELQMVEGVTSAEDMDALLIESCKQTLIESGFAVAGYNVFYTFIDSPADMQPLVEAVDGAVAANKTKVALYGAVAGFLGLVLALIAFALKAALYVGKTHFFVAFDKDRETSVNQIFAWFKKGRFFKAVAMKLWMLWYETIVPVVVLMVGMVAAGVLAALSLTFGTQLAIAALITALVAVLAAGVLEFYYGTKYTMSTYLLVNFPQVKAHDAVKESRRLMKGHKWEYAVFELSWLGWEILSAFTFGFLQLYIKPYYYMAREKLYDSFFELALENGRQSEAFTPAVPEIAPEITDWDGFDRIDEIKLADETDNENKYSTEG